MRWQNASRLIGRSGQLSWRTIEEPDDLLRAIQANAAPGDAVVVDCLTLWVSNVLLKAIGPERDADTMPLTAWTAIEASVENEAQALLTDARDRELTLILVSNEVGMGVVPPHRWGGTIAISSGESIRWWGAQPMLSS